MSVKFNGVDAGNGGVRWYNPETGHVQEKSLDDYGLTHDISEIEFSRQIIKTKMRNMELHPDHKQCKETEGAFCINGIWSDKDLRITFATGNRDKIVISKNLTDFLFCSTNQPFTSCYKLANGTENKLKLYNKITGYYITYITQETAEYFYNGRNYIHPKMNARAWLFESPDGINFTVGRPYGKSGYELRDALRRWLPTGTTIGWKLSEEQENVQNYQYDNFLEGKTIHDKYDNTFNTNPLYKDSPIVIKYKEQK